MMYEILIAAVTKYSAFCYGTLCVSLRFETMLFLLHALCYFLEWHTFQEVSDVFL
jgi:hypothetical protein